MSVITICPGTDVSNLPILFLGCPSGPVQDTFGTGLPPITGRKATRITELLRRTISGCSTGVASGGTNTDCEW